MRHTFKPGERVERWVQKGGWIPGTVVKVGKGWEANCIKIHDDGAVGWKSDYVYFTYVRPFSVLDQIVRAVSS